MIKLYKEIQTEIDEHFNSYITGLFTVSGGQRKYYYWSVDFFSSVGGLSFRHYDLDARQKDQINILGEHYFKSNEIQFSVNKNSHRNDLLIKNINRLFSEEEKARQSAKYEYLKEFILWQLLSSLKNEIATELEQRQKSLASSIKIEHKKILQLITLTELKIQNFSRLIDQQKKNFLITYISYLCSEYSQPIHTAFKEHYISYLLTSQGQELKNKLSDLKANYDYENLILTEKIARLYVLKKEETKIHFVFSREGGGEKEELRELLEVMGKEETGKLYRGQANSSWCLDSSMTRQSRYLAHEAEMYYEILSLKPDAFENDNTIYERLITMQHFGMPTRLLDITRNPLVAIFFACNNYECKSDDGVIFTFSPKNKKDFLNFEDKKLMQSLPYLFNHNTSGNIDDSNEFLSQIWFIKGIAKNQRINNQSGDFIFVGKSEKIKEELHHLPNMSIIIDCETKKVLLEQLESLNIHGGAVYPDLTHMSNYISNKYLLDSKLVTNTKVNTNEQEETTNPVITKPRIFDNIIEHKIANAEFDFVAIKSKTRSEQLNTFADFYQMEPEGVDKIIKDFIFTEKKPFRDEVVKIMHNKPPLKGRASVIESLIGEIITLAKMIDTE